MASGAECFDSDIPISSALPDEHIINSKKLNDKVVVSVEKRRWTAKEKESPVRSVKVLSFSVVDRKLSDLVVMTRQCRLCDTVGRFIMDSMKLMHKDHPSSYPRYKYISAFTYFNGVPEDIGTIEQGKTLDAAGVCDRDWVFLMYNGFSNRTQTSIVQTVGEMLPLDEGEQKGFFPSVCQSLSVTEEVGDDDETEDENPLTAYVKALTPVKRRPLSNSSGVSSVPAADLGNLNLEGRGKNSGTESEEEN